MAEPIVQLKDVSKWYDSDPDRRVLDHLNLSITEGERFAIVGRSGCGKSTLLNLIGTLDQPSEGEIIVANQAISQCREDALAAIRAREIGFIFQLHHLLPQSTALENVLIPTLALSDRPDPTESAARATELLERVGLADKLHSRPSQLSGGERQRVAVVRALINRPRLLLADEPTGALDETNATLLVDLLVELNESADQNLAVVMVTHDLDLANRLGSVRSLTRGRFD